VLKLRTGDKVSVKLESGVYSGKVEAVDPDSVSITTSDKQQLLILPREKVSLIRDHGRSKLGAWLVVGGLLLGAVWMAGETASDVSALSSGGFPESHGPAGAVVAFGITTTGVVMLLKGGSKVIYQRPSASPGPPGR